MKLVIIAVLATVIVLWGFFALIDHTQPEPDELAKLSLGFIAALASIFLTFIFGGASNEQKGRWIIFLVQFTIIMIVVAIYTFVEFNQQVDGIIS